MQLPNGNYVDSQRTPVDLQQLGVDTSVPVCYQASEDTQEEMFDVTQKSTTHTALSSSTLPSLPSTDRTVNNESQHSVISIPSVQTVLSNVHHSGERCLVTQEPKSGLFEDHLLPSLDSGVKLNKDYFFSTKTILFISGLHLVNNM